MRGGKSDGFGTKRGIYGNRSSGLIHRKNTDGRLIQVLNRDFFIGNEVRSNGPSFDLVYGANVGGL